MADAYEMARKQREISIAEFFEKNRHLLGFDNRRKALLTAVKEAVDNSLDAAEYGRILPDVNVEINQLSEFKYSIVVEDNGPGVVKAQIPKVFAKLLYGSKFFKLSESRGQQGLGISAAILYAQLTTGRPAKITSKISPKEPAHYYELHIDVKENAPKIVKEEIVNWKKEHGTRVELTIEAEYLKGSQSVDEYIKQTALINPHASITYTSPKGEQFVYGRATEELPPLPKEIKPHPYGIEIGLLMRMLESASARTLQSFLMSEFSRVGSGTAKEICENASLLPATKPSGMSREQAERLIEGISKTRIIAPQTDCISPIGGELLEKGLRKEVEAEFYCSTSRPPTVYRGNPFVVECCTGDTKLLLECGKIMTIKDYVEESCSDGVFSMDKNLKISPTKVVAAHKFKNTHKIVKITTRSGKSLKVTDNNEVPILENGNVIWVKAADVIAGDYIATPRAINVNASYLSALDILPANNVKVMNNELVKEILLKLKEEYGSLKEAAKLFKVKYEYVKSMNRNKCIGRPSLRLLLSMSDLIGLDRVGIKEKISSIAYVDNRFNNPVPIKVPPMCEELLYTLGLLNSDGYLSKARISFVNKDEKLHEVFSKNIELLFGLEAKRYVKTESSVSNKTAYEFFKALKSKLSELPTNLITAWLKGYVDGDGYPKTGVNGKITGIGIATARFEEAKLVQSLLLRLGIASAITTINPSGHVGFIGKRALKTIKVKHDIVIREFESVQRFANLISFRQVKRACRLANALRHEINVRGELIPVGQTLKDLRTENNLLQNQLGFSDVSVREIEHGRQTITRLHLQQIVSSRALSGTALRQLKLLAFSDIRWERIVLIEEHPFEEYVYDLTTRNGNFLADNIIMHNCAIAYGGKIQAERSVTLMRFANRVPLLYQQGACAITESLAEINWKPYGLQQSGSSMPQGPAIIVAHMASVWVPFTSEAKEAIAHYPEIMREVKLALQECGRKLGIYVNRKTRATQQLERANLFERYIPEVADSLATITKTDKDKLLIKLKNMLNKDEIKAQLAIDLPEEENGEAEK